MARGRKTGGRQKGTRNRATEEARAAAAATGVLSLDYMLRAVPASDAVCRIYSHDSQTTSQPFGNVSDIKPKQRYASELAETTRGRRLG
jgi:hypothetical protein